MLKRERPVEAVFESDSHPGVKVAEAIIHLVHGAVDEKFSAPAR
jgi:hypothetical protein